MDCLYCDRCRYEVPKGISAQELKSIRAFVPRAFMTYVLIVGIFVSAVSVNRFLQVIPAGISQPVVSASGTGQPRDVDLQRIRTMIQQGKLSDKEAEFYKKTE
jgi:hypothetical protein